MTLPRVFIGTMYCGEHDFERCKQALLSQADVSIEHCIIENLPEKEAHNRLWDSWRAVQNTTFDMFVKVDADTVLMHDRVLIELWNTLQSNKRITGIQAPLHDYYTDGFINGLNCFTNSVTFSPSIDPLYCDRNVDSGHDIVLKAEHVSDALKPAGQHCHHASAMQSFHFGLHRTLKNQHPTLARVRAAWERKHSEKLDDNRSYALLGASVAGSFTRAGGFNYNDPELLQAFNDAETRKEQLLGVSK